MDTGNFPTDNPTAGLAAPASIAGKYVVSVTNNNGVISVVYGNSAHTTLATNALLLSAAQNAGSIEWVCKSTTIANKHLPAACRT
jgi:type IV pilus assembly protein PilA